MKKFVKDTSVLSLPLSEMVQDDERNIKGFFFTANSAKSCPNGVWQKANLGNPKMKWICPWQWPRITVIESLIHKGNRDIAGSNQGHISVHRWSTYLRQFHIWCQKETYWTNTNIKQKKVGSRSEKYQSLHFDGTQVQVLPCLGHSVPASSCWILLKLLDLSPHTRYVVNKTWPQILKRWHQKIISWHQFKPGTKN